MGLNTTAKDTDTVAWISCDDCQAEAARTQSQDKTRAKKRAERLAEDAGFVWYDGGKTWVCPACRIRRLPDKMKAEFPKLCERYGIPVPKPDSAPKPVRKRYRSSTTGRRKAAVVESPVEADTRPATQTTEGEPDTAPRPTEARDTT